VKCPSFRKCGQYAMEAPLDSVVEPAGREIIIALRHA
jgi:hypothetical protein